MQITMEPIGSIRPYPNNPRKNRSAINKVARSLKEFGWRQPIVVDEERVIIAGHTRLEAAKRLGMSEVPVHVAADITPEQAKAYRIADNRVGAEAEWDKDQLKLELRELEILGVDMTLTGFEETELTLIAEGGTLGVSDEPDEPRERNTVIQFNIVFESTEQQATWFSFMKYLRGVFPNKDTLGERLEAFIEENDFKTQD